MRTRLVNVVRGLARQQRIELRPRALRTHGGWGQLAAADLSPALREVVVAYEATVQAVGTALGALDRQLAQRARRDPRVARLETMPGVGPVCAQTLVAAVDTINRFATAKKLVAYAGLAPSVRASGERVEYGRITKQGRSEIRAVWVQAAHAALAVKGAAAAPLQRWWGRVARRRGKKTAVVALARKLLTIAFHLLQDGTMYDARRLNVGNASDTFSSSPWPRIACFDLAARTQTVAPPPPARQRPARGIGRAERSAHTSSRGMGKQTGPAAPGGGAMTR
jgi:transposase